MLNKELMSEVAVLYYEKGLTQQEIARELFLSRQTVSKLLSQALKDKVVEITVHCAKKDCERLELELKNKFGVNNAVVCSTSSNVSLIRQLMTIKGAVNYLLPIIEEGNKNVAVSWGRTIQALISEFPEINTAGNMVFPLFGATNHEEVCFASNELSRLFADKISAKVKYAWFPYKPDNDLDEELFKNTSYYKNLRELWDNIDLAVVGIGNSKVIQFFEKTFGYSEKNCDVVGDIVTHFFNADGEIVKLRSNTLRATTDNLKKAKEVVAVASGDDKIIAIKGALKTGLIDTLITDELTAKAILK